MSRFLVLLLLWFDPSSRTCVVGSGSSLFVQGAATATPGGTRNKQQSTNMKKRQEQQQRALNPSAWEEITFDTFEDGGGGETWGSYEPGERKADLKSGKDYFDDIFSSSVSAVVSDDKNPPDSSFFHSDFHDVSLYDDLKIHFYYYSEKMRDGNDEFLVEYSTAPGGPWNEVEVINRFFGNERALERTITFSEDAASIDVQSMSSIKLRFRCDGGDRKSKVYVDQIRFQGHLADTEPSSAPSSTPSAEPSLSPSALPSSAPSPGPSEKPSSAPTATPSSNPSDKDPTGSPSTSPSLGPTMVPSSSPSVAPSPGPSSMPSKSSSPSSLPSKTPTVGPTSVPSKVPSRAPSTAPSSGPTQSSFHPSASPTQTESGSPTDVLTRDEICPVDRLYPPSKYEIMPYDSASTAGVEDDLGEISSLAFSDQTDAEGHLYAYVASDKNQFSLKVIRFQRHAENGQVVMGNATTVAVYALNVGYSNSDWEDISLGPCKSSPDSETCIYIGDFGNNNRGGGYEQRSVVRIIKFPEPIWNSEQPTDLENLSVTTIPYRYDGQGFDGNVFYDAEAMFVDWVGPFENEVGRGDIIIVTKGRCGPGRVGRIPVSHHENLPLGNAPTYSMSAIMSEPPMQGIDTTCGEGPFRLWQGADMRQDGRLIALITGQSPPRVHFYPRLAGQSVVDAFSTIVENEGANCPYIASTSHGLDNEKKYESVAFLPDGQGFAETSECASRSCNVPIYFWDLIFPGSTDATFPHMLAPASEEGDGAGWVVITEDGFEEAEYDHFGSFVSGTRAYTSQGAYVCPLPVTGENSWSVRIHLHDGEESAIWHKNNHDASTYNWLKVQFDFLLDGFDLMDTLFLELSLDGGATYFIVADWAQGTQDITDQRRCYMKNTVVLNAEAFGQSTFGDKVRLRFRTSANAMNDNVYIDNVLFQGLAE